VGVKTVTATGNWSLYAGTVNFLIPMMMEFELLEVKGRSRSEGCHSKLRAAISGSPWDHVLRWTRMNHNLSCVSELYQTP
jgi:hypothetical protein